MEKRNFLNKVKRGENVYGTSIVSTSPVWANVAHNAMLDFVFVDLEYNTDLYNEIANLSQTYRSMGIIPLVRIPNTDYYTACMVRDAGAIGLVVPYVERVEQVRDLVGATKYRPLKGVFLRNVITGKVKLTGNLESYISDFNKESICIITIESKAGLVNLDALLNVPGLDGVIIEPRNLSVSMRIPEEYENPRFEKAIKEIIHRTRDKGLVVGVHLPGNPELQIKYMKEGCNMILHGSDISLYEQKLLEDLANIKKSAEEISEKEQWDLPLSQIPDELK